VPVGVPELPELLGLPAQDVGDARCLLLKFRRSGNFVKSTHYRLMCKKRSLPPYHSIKFNNIPQQSRPIFDKSDQRDRDGSRPADRVLTAADTSPLLTNTPMRASSPCSFRVTAGTAAQTGPDSRPVPVVLAWMHQRDSNGGAEDAVGWRIAWRSYRKLVPRHDSQAQRFTLSHP